MSHPFNKFRQSNVERSRVAPMISGYKKGGSVHPDAEQDKKLIKKMLGKELGEIGGVKAKMRSDRPHRASGGKVGKKATTVVNVITGGQQQPPAPPPMPMGPPPGAAMPPPPPPPGAMAGPGPGMPPPGVGGPPMMRARGGRATGGSVEGYDPPYDAGAQSKKAAAVKDYSLGTKGYAKGGGVKSKGMNVGTKVQHDTSHNDLKDMHRKRVVTFNTGGGVKSFMAGGKVGRLESPDGVAPATKLPGGAGGGLGRLAKARKY